MRSTISTKPDESRTSHNTRGAWRRFFSPREMGVYFALLLVVLVLSLATMYLGRVNYLSLLNIRNVLFQSSLTGIMAVAMTVILITGNIDLSVAAVAALAAALFIGTSATIGFFPGLLVSLAAAILVGLVNGAIVIFLEVNAFIVTLGTLTAVRGLVLIYTNGQSLTANSGGVINGMMALESGMWPMGLVLFAIGIALLVGAGIRLWKDRRAGRGVTPAPVVMAVIGVLLGILVAWHGFVLDLPKLVVYLLVFTACAWAVLSLTSVGRKLYAVGGNPEAARLSGISVVRYKMLAFVLCSLAAGVAGILFASRLQSIDPSGLQGAELTVIAAAILGGTSLLGGVGSVVKSVAGALLLFSLTNGFNILNLGANYQGVIEGTVIVTAAAIYTVGRSNRRGKN